MKHAALGDPRRLLIVDYLTTGDQTVTELAELVERKYLRAAPVDPFTESADSWTIIPPEAGAPGGVYDLKSTASGNARDGTPLSDL